MWSDENLLSLIDIYRSYEVLWNPSDPYFYKKNEKKDAWAEIANAMSKSEEECKNKIISLLSSYRREKAKERKSSTTVKDISPGTKRYTIHSKSTTDITSASKVYKSRWFGFQALRFLDDRDKPKRNLDTDGTGTEVTPAERENGVPDQAGAIDEDSHLPFLDESAKEIPIDVQPGTSAQIETQPLFKLSARKKRKVDESNAVMKDALSILKEKFRKSDNLDSEIKSFGSLITTKMNTYSSTTRIRVQHEIFHILMKADLGHFEYQTNLLLPMYQPPPPMYPQPPPMYQQPPPMYQQPPPMYPRPPPPPMQTPYSQPFPVTQTSSKQYNNSYNKHPPKAPINRPTHQQYPPTETCTTIRDFSTSPTVPSNDPTPSNTPTPTPSYQSILNSPSPNDSFPI